MSRAWQQQERLVAEWFGTKRTPLSGPNDRWDDGTGRLGDVLFRPAVVEVKRRKEVSFKYAEETARKAKKVGLPWLCVEFKTGKAGFVKLAMTKETAAFVCDELRRAWEETWRRGRSKDAL